MPTAKEVEVRACRTETEDGETDAVVWATEAEAEFFSIYTGEPGAFTWNADFGDKDDALRYGRDRALRLSARFADRIGEVPNVQA